MCLPKFEDMFKQIFIYFQIMGVPNDGKLGFRFYSCCFVITLILIEELGFFISKFTSGTSEQSVNILELTTLAPCFGIGILSLSKFLCIISKRQKILNLMKHLKYLYNITLSNPKHKMLISSDIKFVKSFTGYYFVLNVVLVSVYNFSTLFIIMYRYIADGVVVYSLPYAVVVPFSTDVALGWFLVYTHSIISGYICVFYFTIVDALYYNLCCHVCNNFKILNHDILILERNNIVVLNDLVKRHQHILKLAEDLEDIFTAPNLLNVLVASLEICALGFNLMAGSWAEFPQVVLFIFSELLQIFFLCVFGDNIMRESRQVGQSAFMCEWFDMDVSSQKIILIMMIRANKPNVLTAYKFSTISYASFSKIVSNSWSYFTILRNVYSDMN